MGCPISLVPWRQAGFIVPHSLGNNANGIAIVDWVLSLESAQHRSLACAILWSLWNARNKVFFNEDHLLFDYPRISRIVDKEVRAGMTLVEAWKMAPPSSHLPVALASLHRVDRSVQWTPPLPNVLKLRLTPTLLSVQTLPRFWASWLGMRHTGVKLGVGRRYVVFPNPSLVKNGT